MVVVGLALRTHEKWLSHDQGAPVWCRRNGIIFSRLLLRWSLRLVNQVLLHPRKLLTRGSCGLFHCLTHCVLILLPIGIVKLIVKFSTVVPSSADADIGVRRS